MRSPSRVAHVGAGQIGHADRARDGAHGAPGEVVKQIGSAREDPQPPAARLQQGADAVPRIGRLLLDVQNVGTAPVDFHDDFWRDRVAHLLHHHRHRAGLTQGQVVPRAGPRRGPRPSGPAPVAGGGRRPPVPPARRRGGRGRSLSAVLPAVQPMIRGTRPAVCSAQSSSKSRRSSRVILPDSLAPPVAARPCVPGGDEVVHDAPLALTVDLSALGAGGVDDGEDPPQGWPGRCWRSRGPIVRRGRPPASISPPRAGGGGTGRCRRARQKTAGRRNGNARPRHDRRPARRRGAPAGSGSPSGGVDAKTAGDGALPDLVDARPGAAPWTSGRRTLRRSSPTSP